MDKRLSIFWDLCFELKFRSLITCSQLSCVCAFLTNHFIIHCFDISSFRAFENTDSLISEIRARNTRIVWHISICSIFADSIACIFIHIFEVVELIIRLARETFWSRNITSYTSALAWFAFVIKIVSEVPIFTL